MCFLFLQSLLPTSVTVKRGGRRPTVRPVQDDDDDEVISMTSLVISMTSQNGRRHPVVHRDAVYGGGRLYTDGVVSNGHSGGTELAALPSSAPPLLGAVNRPRRRLRLVHRREAFSARPWWMNDVTVESTDHRRQHFPTPIDRSPTMTVDRCRLPQPLFRPLENHYQLDRTPPFWTRHPSYPEQYLDCVQWPAGARQRQQRRVLPAVPSDLPRCSNFMSAREAAAAFQLRPMFAVSNGCDSDNDSISI